MPRDHEEITLVDVIGSVSVEDYKQDDGVRPEKKEDLEANLETVETTLSVLREGKNVLEPFFAYAEEKFREQVFNLVNTCDSIESFKEAQGFARGLLEVRSVIPLLEAERTRLEGKVEGHSSDSPA